jgi:hypothetical protein
LRTLYDINKLEPFVSQTLDQIQHKVLKKDFSVSILKENAANIIFIEAYLLIASGLLSIFGFRLAKVTGFLAIFIELLFVHNAYFYREQKYIITSSIYIALFGGILNI